MIDGGPITTWANGAGVFGGVACSDAGMQSIESVPDNVPVCVSWTLTTSVEGISLRSPPVFVEDFQVFDTPGLGAISEIVGNGLGFGVSFFNVAIGPNSHAGVNGAAMFVVAGVAVTALTSTVVTLPRTDVATVLKSASRDCVEIETSVWKFLIVTVRPGSTPSGTVAESVIGSVTLARVSTVQ